MGKDIGSADDWHGEFERIHESVDRVRSVVEGIAKWIWDNVVAKDVFPPQMPPGVAEYLRVIDHELRSIEQVGANLKWYFCSNPLQKWLSGQKLTREEFYLLVAQGVWTISGSDEEDEYEEFAHFLYEDDERRGYINPSERPNAPPVQKDGGARVQKVHLKIGIMPEDVRTSFLSPAQLDFFKKFRPELFSRFRKD
jgi:hypothetical protein